MAQQFGGAPISQMALMQMANAFAPKVDPPGQVIGQPQVVQQQQQAQQQGPGLFSAMEQGPSPMASVPNPENDKPLFQANQEMVEAGRAYQKAATPITTGLGRMGVIEGIARHFTSKDEREAYEKSVDQTNAAKFNAQSNAARLLAQDVFQMGTTLGLPRDTVQAMADRALVDSKYGTQLQQSLLGEMQKQRDADRARAEEAKDEMDLTQSILALNPGMSPQQAAQIAKTENLDPVQAVKQLQEREQYLQERQEKKYQDVIAMNSEKAAMRNSVRQIERTISQVNPWSAGFASYGAIVRGTPSFDLLEMLKTQQATVAFERLQAMRTDPRNETGGALGNVSNREIELLYSSMAPLHAGMSPAELRASLNDILSSFDIALYGMEKEKEYFKRVKAGEMDEDQAAALLEAEAFQFANNRMIARASAGEDAPYSAKVQKAALQAVMAGDDTVENFEATFGWRPVIAGDVSRYMK